MNFDYIYKFIIIGDSGVGKSCILMQFTQNMFDPGKENTVGVEFGNKIVKVDGLPVKLQIWDTAGQEQFKSITRSYYRSVSAALLVYDVTNLESFNNLKNWIEEAKANANNELSIVLCGNKIDKENRVVSTEVGMRLAKDYGLTYIETSAKLNQNVETVFMTMAKQVQKKVEAGLLDVNLEEYGVKRCVDLGENPAKGLKASKADPKQKKSKKCC